MNDESWVLLWRKFQKRLERPYQNSNALLWLIFNVVPNGNDIGKISTTLNELAYEWGWFRKGNGMPRPDTQKVREFLEELDKECSVSVSPSLAQSRIGLLKPSKTNYTITLLKYAFFQRKDTGPDLVVDGNIVMPFSMSRTFVPEVAKKTTSFNPLKNKEQRRKKKESTKIISDVATSQRTKIEKPKQESTNEFRRVTDYMWETYEKNYGVKPDSMANTALFKIFRPLVTEWGEEICKRAWDVWLESEEKIPLECNHSPKTFSSTFWFNKCRVGATRVKTSIWDMSEEEKQARREKDEEEFEAWAEKERQKEEGLL